ncbi:MAG: WecB/TagA/CpsF family glycosyltransferase [Patescibacteria group bacterium]
MTTKKDQRIGLILKMAQNSSSKNRVLAFVRSKLNSNKRFSVLSANPEILLLALKDNSLASILFSSDILINDGVGLCIANDFLSEKTYKNKFLAFFAYIFQGFRQGFTTLFLKNKKVLKGRDLFMNIIRLGNKLNWKIFLLGGKKDEALKTKEKLEVSFKQIKIQQDPGPILNSFGQPVSKNEKVKQKAIIRKINLFKPDIVFVGLGAPKQEYWINSNAKNLDSKGIVAVGGTYNYIAGNMRLPMSFFEKAGLEWFWRLIIEPKRIVRILNAVIVFPLKVFLYKLNQD